MRGCMGIIGLLFVIGVLIKIWPLLVIGLVVWGGVVLIRREIQQRTRTRASEHAAEIEKHREALAYWRTQLHEAETPAARQVAEDLITFNAQRLADLERGTDHDQASHGCCWGR